MRNKIVVHFKDGRLLKGYTLDFTPIKKIFHLTSEMEEDAGKTYEISTTELKAIFFVKTLKGNKDYYEKKSFDEIDKTKLRGIKLEVEFFDGEIISGTSFVYKSDKEGFFMVPLDEKSNNSRIYIIKDAACSIKTL
ncbi:MAG: hypothetical protein B5M53_05240 [Candidatus Cloacimonas sp. 4484_209]|nr:MAG: hypothetical protein B5M53_05240 [Candidatus Cloacimonas sp. 4484_209]